MRQQNGYHGRPNKPVDTCYSFWVGATLKVREALDIYTRLKLVQDLLHTHKARHLLNKTT